MGDAEPDDLDFEDDLVYCVECRAEVYADTPRCPRCGRWFMGDDRLEMAWEPPRPLWMKAVAVLLLAIMGLGIIAAIIVALVV